MFCASFSWTNDDRSRWTRMARHLYFFSSFTFHTFSSFPLFLFQCAAAPPTHTKREGFAKFYYYFSFQSEIMFSSLDSLRRADGGGKGCMWRSTKQHCWIQLTSDFQSSFVDSDEVNLFKLRGKGLRAFEFQLKISNTTWSEVCTCDFQQLNSALLSPKTFLCNAVRREWKLFSSQLHCLHICPDPLCIFPAQQYINAGGLWAYTTLINDTVFLSLESRFII